MAGASIMGAVWGIVNLNKENVSKEQGFTMMKMLSKYSFDKTDIWNKEEVFLGCGIQINTPESASEKLPYYDTDCDLCITADAIIDNRQELFKEFNISNEKSNITDSQLILLSYKKWGYDCPKYLIGDFAFVIWDKRKKELFCVRDHTGTRALYYYENNKTLVFSTVMSPILKLMKEKIELNDKWISDFLYLEGVIHEVEISETVYKQIYQVPPGHYIIYSSKGLYKKKYWSLEKVKPLKLKSEEEYYKAFRLVFDEAVKCRLRSAGKVGIMLSSGLDSSSVGAVAARSLAKEGKSLEAFTSIPMEDYEDFLPNSSVANESQLINELKNYYSNIELNFCRCEGRNSFADIDEFIEILEQPYKMINNLFWIDDILREAERKNCKIVLTGQYGNFTISYGNFLTHIYTLFKKLKWVTCLKEIRAFCNLNSIAAGYVLKNIGKRIIKSNNIVNYFINRRKKVKEELIFANRKLLKKWNTEKRTDRAGYGRKIDKLYDSRERKQIATNFVLFSHVGSLETKLSLTRGNIMRDPTRDKRVIEFCLSLPDELYVSEGRQRLLIRNSMKGEVPDKIRLNFNTRGKQSADWVQRLYPFWDDICTEFKNLLKDEEISEYVDIAKLNEIFNKIGTKLNKETYGLGVRTLIITIILNRFRKKMAKEYTF